MSAPDIEYLKIHFYYPLYAKLTENNNTHNSILLSILSKTSNWRYDYFKQLSQSGESEDQDIIDILIRKKLIRATDEHNRYQITAFGVWEIESEFVRIDQIVNVFDEKYFDVFSKNRRLNPKEKVALLSLIAARTFSEKCPLNRENGASVLEYWLEIFEKSESFLLAHSIISKRVDLNNKKHQEGAVAYLIRRLNDLTKKTHNIYKSLNNVAYLDLYDCDEGKFDTDGLSYLYWKVFERELDSTFQQEIFDFCTSIIREYKPVIFNASEHAAHGFSKLEYDDIIKEALFRADINKNSFEIRESG